MTPRCERGELFGRSPPIWLLVVVLGWAPGCDTPSADRSDPGASSQLAHRVTLPDEVIGGVCLAHNWKDGGQHGYGSSKSAETLDHLADLGVDSVSLTPFGWMRSLEATSVRGEHDDSMPDGAEHRARLERAVEQARARDLSVMLKPHVWIRGGKWRGRIRPRRDGTTDWQTWWESYRSFITHYADIAADLGVRSFVVGVELTSALKATPEQMVRTIEAVRDRYDGHVTYGANWDRSVPDSVGRRLDALGVQFYPPLTDDPDPSVELLRRALRPELDRWTDRAAALDLPLDIVEVGYKSAETAVATPFGWPDDVPPDRRRSDPELQRDAYRALFAELRGRKRLRSVYVWKYFTDPSRDHGGPLGFSPRGKPAERLLRRAYSADSE